VVRPLVPRFSSWPKKHRETRLENLPSTAPLHRFSLGSGDFTRDLRGLNPDPLLSKIIGRASAEAGKQGLAGL
jgi:hypothetical protein